MFWIGSPWLEVINGEGSENFSVVGENRRRPACAQAMSKSKLPGIRPERITCNIRHDYLFATVNRRSARAYAGSDLYSFNRLREIFGQTWRGGRMKRGPIRIK